ncbi:TerB family tellurite resistance protein [Palleronia sediminis]|uniref:TerB family tellurite resistance protein n=1 Tax=Palleronia sediminis TaxID=2547833 RepID=A0A4R6A1J0_9RHOB|nr:TerB family tellurite resistance protein [Palleronia sediminis]TDL76287.1 TerB family tellurite resistance protein [Palleronia sediminis]
MIADFLRRLTESPPEALPDPDARLALTALLVRLARADNVFTAQERTRIQNIVCERYGLDRAGAEALVVEAEAVEREAPDTVRFTRAIKDAVDYDDRIGVIEAMWAVVLVDGHRDDEEDALLRMVAPLLGVNDRDSNLARRRVEARFST